jgi:hypothetical protein
VSHGAAARGWLPALSGLLIEPKGDAAAVGGGLSGGRRPAIAVAGLSRRSGATTVARALGAELALRDPAGAAVVTASAVAAPGIPLGTAAAGRLCRSLTRTVGAAGRAVGRICLLEATAAEASSLADEARSLAPLVIDIADPSSIARVAADAGAVVLVAAPTSEPALAAVVRASLSQVVSEPIVVVNRDLGDSGRWVAAADVFLPEARVAARLALAGRDARGPYGRAIAGLADRIQQLT